MGPFMNKNASKYSRSNFNLDEDQMKGVKTDFFFGVDNQSFIEDNILKATRSKTHEEMKVTSAIFYRNMEERDATRGGQAVSAFTRPKMKVTDLIRVEEQNKDITDVDLEKMYNEQRQHSHIGLKHKHKPPFEPSHKKKDLRTGNCTPKRNLQQKIKPFGMNNQINFSQPDFLQNEHVNNPQADGIL